MYPFYEVRDDSKQNYFSSFTTENLSFPPHFHSHTELIYVTEGAISVSVNDKKAVLQQGDIAVSFPNDVHSYNTELFSKAVVLIFSPKIIGSYFGSLKDKTIKNPFIKKNTYDLSVMNFINILKEEFEDTNDHYVIKGLLYSIFGKLNRNFILIDNNNLYDTTIQIILKHIARNFCENITLNSIARDLGYSPFHLSRLFNQKIGYQFNDYINSLRINMAQRLLSETDMTISSIALDCGFESLRNFNRVFKKHLNATPRDFRRLFRS
jgi:AraC-like DNA-binding protein